MSTVAAEDTPVAERASSIGWAIASLSLSTLLSSLGISIANVALPTLAQAFDATFQEAQWVTLAYLLAVTALIVSAGRLGDIVGRKRLLLIGTLLFTAASLLCGAAPTLWLLIAARAAQGIGAAVMMALTMAMVSEAVPKARTGRAMGLLGTMSAIGTALGPSLGGLLISGMGWRAIFLVAVPLGIVTLFLAYRFLPVDDLSRKTSRIGFDNAGTFLLALTLTGYALAMTTGHGDFGALNMTLLGLSVAGLGLFMRVEMRAASPVIKLEMFRDPGLSAGLAMSALVMTVMMATLVVGPFYLSHALALDAAQVGLVMSVGPLVTAVSGIPAGRLVDRSGTQNMITAGLVGVLTGSVMLSTVPMKFGVVGYITSLMIMTCGYALFQSANNTSVMMDASSDQRGVVSGMLNLSRNLGVITGAAFLGAVFAFVAKADDIAKAGVDAITAGMQVTFVVAAVLIVVAIAIACAHRTLSIRRPS